MIIARRCIVSGRVQGVAFRWSARERARELGLSGSARNLRDGSVEVFVQGAQAKVDLLCDWLWHGPPHARVQAVRCRETATQDLWDFETS